MKNIARLFAAASVTVGGLVVVGCQDDMGHSSTHSRAGTTSAGSAEVGPARTAGSSTGAVDPIGRTHSGSPSTSGLGGVGGTTGTAGVRGAGGVGGVGGTAGSS